MIYDVNLPLFRSFHSQKGGADKRSARSLLASSNPCLLDAKKKNPQPAARRLLVFGCAAIFLFALRSMASGDHARGTGRLGRVEFGYCENLAPQIRGKRFIRNRGHRQGRRGCCNP